RNEIKLEKYSTKISIEANVLVDLSLSQIIPAAVNYQNVLVENVKGLKDIFGDEFKELAKDQMELIRVISTHINAIKSATDQLIKESKITKEISDHQKQAEAYSANVKPLFDVIRYNSDELEELIDNNLWPLTKYREMLFTR
ncbi:MAG: glutamine synthetase type III, partial [Algoriella sp.]